MRFPEANLIVDHFDEPELDFAMTKEATTQRMAFFYTDLMTGQRSFERFGLGLSERRTGSATSARGVDDYFQGYQCRLRGPTEKKDRLHLADFAGLEETFGVTFDPNRLRALTVDFDAIERATRVQNIHEAVDAVARIYTERVNKFRRNEEGSIDVWIFVVPEIVYERCRPESRRTGLTLVAGQTPKKQRARSPQSFLFMDERFDPRIENVFDDIPDFRRHIKATLLSIAPSQILRESTLEPTAFLNSAGYPKRGTQDAATVAWNIATGLYYKTQDRPPWRLSNVREGVCYIGMVYKNLPNNRDNHVCCAAQMFLSEGDGVVFRGANGPWKTGKYEYHLNASAAEELLGTVIEAYRDLHSEPPKELFIHGQASFNDEEWHAFCRAAPKETNVIGVRIRPTGGDAKLFREGDYPVIRGTALNLDEKNAYLWTSGYVPQLDTYIGPETPNPLMVTILRSKHRQPEMRTVLSDIMGLTKINYNSCNFNDGLPVTVRFAKMVGDILVMGSAREGGPQPFKYYI